MFAAIKAIEFFLPKQVLTNNDLEKEYPEWTVRKIEEKTGISARHISSDGECSSDLAYQAALKLFDSGLCAPSMIDYILLCTQSPDYFLPTTACILQERLNIPFLVGAIDYNLGCSGYVYGLGLAKGLIETDQAQNILLLTAETYSKFLKRDDKSVRTIFGDAASATLIGAHDDSSSYLGPFVYGTNGGGAKKLIVERGGMRNPIGIGIQSFEKSDIFPTLYMNGPEIFNFTLNVIPDLVKSTLDKAKKTIEEIDWFVFHQANLFILDYLREKIKIPKDKFIISMNDCGNTVSSTIPIALKKMIDANQLSHGQEIMIVGFGVGYSWASSVIRWI
jgi:3-oxoacyl-[acyl-carrier-protein] synthase III